MEDVGLELGPQEQWEEEMGRVGRRGSLGCGNGTDQAC